MRARSKESLCCSFLLTDDLLLREAVGAAMLTAIKRVQKYEIASRNLCIMVSCYVPIYLVVSLADIKEITIRNSVEWRLVYSYEVLVCNFFSKPLRDGMCILVKLYAAQYDLLVAQEIFFIVLFGFDLV